MCICMAALRVLTILSALERMLRVDATFPEHEISIEKARSLLSSKVKTIRLKEIQRKASILMP